MLSLKRPDLIPIPMRNRFRGHSGIATFTPEQVHHGRAPIVLERRAKVLATAYNAHPERFVSGMPAPTELFGAVWIDPPLEHGATPS